MFNHFKSVCFFLQLLFISIDSFSQADSKALWVRYSCGYNNGLNKMRGDLIPNAICSDSFSNVYNIGTLSGEYFILDTSIIKISNKRIFVNKFTSKGNRIWTRYIQSKSLNSEIRIKGMKSDLNGNLYIIGSVDAKGDSIYMMPNWYKINNAFIAKFDSNWVNLWCMTVEGDLTQPSSMDFTDLSVGGYVYACGNSSIGRFKINGRNYYNPQKSNAFVVALNPYTGKIINGSLIDTGSVNTINSIHVNGYLNVFTTGEIISSKSGAFIAGSLSVKYIPSQVNSYVLKMANVFRPVKLMHAVTYLNGNGATGDGIRGFNYLSIDKDQNIYVAGNLSGDSTVIENVKINSKSNKDNHYKQDIYLTKIDSDGSVVWIKSLYSDGMDLITDLEGDANGDLLLSVGSDLNGVSGLIVQDDTILQGHAGLVRMNSKGEVIHVKTLQLKNYPKAIAYGRNSTFYVTGEGVDFNTYYDSISIINCENENGNPSDSNMYIVGFKGNINSNELSSVNFNISPYYIFPNPSYDKLTIRGNGFEQVEIFVCLYDDVGKVAFKCELGVKLGSNIDISDLNTGVYNMVIETRNGEIYNHRILKF